VEQEPLGNSRSWKVIRLKLNDLTAEYFKEFDLGRLPYLECSSCAHRFYYARTVCPKCFSPEIKMSASSGHGTIFSLTWIHGKDPAEKRSYAMIAMDEGFKLYSSLVDSFDAEIDDRVQVVMLEKNGKKVPYFKKIT
jgi:uncharacterized OB-fold protein